MVTRHAVAAYAEQEGAFSRHRRVQGQAAVHLFHRQIRGAGRHFAQHRHRADRPLDRPSVKQLDAPGGSGPWRSMNSRTSVRTSLCLAVSFSIFSDSWYGIHKYTFTPEPAPCQRSKLLFTGMFINARFFIEKRKCDLTLMALDMLVFINGAKHGAQSVKIAVPVSSVFAGSTSIFVLRPSR